MKIIGDGGHAKVVKDLLITLYGQLPKFFSEYCFIAVGDNRSRMKEAEAHREQYKFMLPLIHPSAVVSESATIGNGTVVMAGAVIQASAKIGENCIINTGASVDHDCVLEDFVHIAPGAHLCGGVHVGEGTLVGVGVGIAPQTTISAWSLVKAGRIEIESL